MRAALAEAVYLFASRDSDGAALDASDGTVYELRLDAADLPPLDEPGFWSLTMYKAADGCLAANPINRYSTRISRPGFQLEAHGSATIVMSAALPDNVAEANWLPAPVDQPFLLGLRLYYPRAPIRDQSWFPPPIRRRG